MKFFILLLQLLPLWFYFKRLQRNIISLYLIKEMSTAVFFSNLLPGRFIIGCVFKNEAEYLDEWISYHLNIGFNTIVLFDNNVGDDDKDAIEIIKQKYSQVKFINKRGLSYDIGGYNFELYKKLSKDQWCLYIDIDEFLTFNDNYTLNDLVNRAEEKKCDQIKINWMVYGNNGKIKKENGTMISRFPKPVQPPDFRKFGRVENTHTKGFVHGELPGSTTIHYFSGPIVGCDTNFKIIQNNSPFTKEVVWGMAYLRHYFTKSEEEWKTKFEKRHRSNNIYGWNNYNEINKYPPNTICNVNPKTGNCR